MRAAAAIFSLLLGAAEVAAKPVELCIFQNRDGTVGQADSRQKVPAQYRAYARCAPVSGNEQLAAPGEIALKGNVREERIPFALGTLSLRWPRTVEPILNRTPLRAMTDVARTVARAIHRPGFPAHLQNLNLDWQVVFMDENLPESQIPGMLLRNCHPGWMTPPANIYIVAQRVVGGCSGGRVTGSAAEGHLARVLIHEMGHAVEYHLLQGHGGFDRMRAEGFATWFESYGAEFSSLANGATIKNETFSVARLAIAASKDTFTFAGSGEDYARAAMYFHALVERRGLDTLLRVYQTMATENLGLFAAIEKAAGWNKERLDSEVERLLRSK